VPRRTGQQPLQMLFSLRSTALSSAPIAASPELFGPVASVPPAALVDVEPVVPDDPVVAGDPDELAVPELLVPGAGGAATFAELPAPLGSLPELLSPPALAGPDGTPLTPAVPAPADPALGEPAALPVPADGPLAAPPALPPAPPLLCGNERVGPVRSAMATIDAVTDILFGIFIEISLSDCNDSTCRRFHDGTISLPRH
jgi:hypothetical protein